jgi:hypothetical protein
LNNEYNPWHIDLSWSQKAFIDLVWPRLSPLIGKGTLKSVELYSEKGFAKELDALAGVDAWQVIDNKGIRPLASRVQIIKKGYKPYNTYSIRKERTKSRARTEYEKLIMAYILQPDKGWLAPTLTCQSYINKAKDTLLSSSIIKTKDLITYVYNHPENCLSKQSDNKFIAVKWDVLSNAGIELVRWP